MELSREILAGLRIIGDNSKISDQKFNKLLSFTFKSILEGSEDSESADSKEWNIDMKKAHAELTALVLEAVKTDSNVSMISSVLEDCDLPTQRKSLLLKEYEEKKDQIRQNLSRFTHELPHIVDVNWRLDYNFKNSAVERDGSLQYILTLQTEQPGQEDSNIKFACSLSELQDIVTKLKTAVISLEKLSKA